MWKKNGALKKNFKIDIYLFYKILKILQRKKMGKVKTRIERNKEIITDVYRWLKVKNSKNGKDKQLKSIEKII